MKIEGSGKEAELTVIGDNFEIGEENYVEYK